VRLGEEDVMGKRWITGQGRSNFMLIFAAITAFLFISESAVYGICGKRSCVIPDSWSPPSSGGGGGRSRTSKERPRDQAKKAWFKGNEYLDQKLLYEAEKHFRKAIAHDPSYGLAYSHLGLAIEDLGRYEEALDMYRKALEVGGTGTHHASNYIKWLLKKMGDKFMEGKDYRRAESMYRETLRLDPDYAYALNNLGLALEYQGKNIEALMFYRKAYHRNQEDSNILKNFLTELRYVGRLQGKNGIYNDAERYYDEALDLVRSHPKLRAKLKNFLAEDFNDAARLPNNNAFQIILAKALVEVDSKDAASHGKLGVVLIQNGDLSEGKSAYREAMRLDPENYHAAELGHYLQEAGDWESAADAYRKYLTLVPSHEVEKIGHTHVLLGTSLAANGEKQAAAEEYRTAMRTLPDNSVVLSRAGQGLADLGHYREAEAALQKALAQDLENTNKYHDQLNLINEKQAVEYTSQDDSKAAEAEYEKIVRRDPGNAAAQKKLEEAQTALRVKKVQSKALVQKRREIIGEIEKTVTLMVHGQPEIFAAVNYPQAGSDQNPLKQIDSVETSSKLAVFSKLDDGASGMARLGFDTSGLPSGPLPAVTLDLKPANPNGEIPPQIRHHPKISKLLLMKSEAERETAAHEQEVDEIERSMEPGPVKFQKIAEGRQKIDDSKNKENFITWTIRDTIPELTRESETKASGTGGEEIVEEDIGQTANR